MFHGVKGQVKRRSGSNQDMPCTPTHTPKNDTRPILNDGTTIFSIFPFFSKIISLLNNNHEIYLFSIGGLLCCKGNLPSHIGMTVNPRWYWAWSDCDSKARRFESSLFDWLRSSWCTICQCMRLKYSETILRAIRRPWRYEMNGDMLRLSQA